MSGTASSAEQLGCAHAVAVAMRNGTLLPDEGLMPFDAAWCRACGAFRESSGTKDPEPWQSPRGE